MGTLYLILSYYILQTCQREADSPNLLHSARTSPISSVPRRARSSADPRSSKGCGPTSRRRSSRTPRTSSTSSRTRRRSPSSARTASGPSVWPSSSRPTCLKSTSSPSLTTSPKQEENFVRTCEFRTPSHQDTCYQYFAIRRPRVTCASKKKKQLYNEYSYID